jgi:hypothetical protein
MPNTSSLAGILAASSASQSAGMTNKSATPIKVTVEKGDTLTSIAKENNTTVKAILAANPKFTEEAKYQGGNMIWSGTKVVIPPKFSTPAKTNTPIVDVPKQVEPPLDTSTTSTSTTTDTTTTDTATTDTATTNTITSSGGYTNATPITPADITTVSVAAGLPPAPPVKTAPIDTILFDNNEVPIEIMTDLIFENIGGHELINIARNDIINGQQISYQPIKNISSIQQQYNPNNIVSLQSTSDKYFANFPIKLENKIPQLGTGPDGGSIYIDPNNGNIVIEIINVELDEQVEVEITVSGTIYEAEFGETVS